MGANFISSVVIHFTMYYLFRCIFSILCLYVHSSVPQNKMVELA